MLWDDFSRVGAPRMGEPAALGLSLGREMFPAALSVALAHAGAHADEARDLGDLERLVQDRKPDFLICTAAALGPDPETFMVRLLDRKPTHPCPVFLVRPERMLAGKEPIPTHFAEIMGSSQDALGYFLMIRAALRRKRPHVMTEVLEFGRLSLHQEKFTLSFGEKVGSLNMLQFCMLGAMLDAPRIVWNKVFLNRVVFGPARLKPGRQFDTFMSIARRAIREKIGVDPIVAEHRMGYALSPTVLGARVIADRGDP